MKRIFWIIMGMALALGYTADAADLGKRILMVVTSHDELKDGKPTGLWVEEFAVPYELFRSAKHDVTVVSPKGGKAPVDPRSLSDQAAYQPDTLAALERTRRLAKQDLEEFDAVFFAGGHGTMFDLPENPKVAETVNYFLLQGKPIALVCHGPAALVGAKTPDGKPVVAGRRLTAFTDDEERAVELDKAMPFLLEARLRELGAEFSGGPNFAGRVVVDKNLITGQNPASSSAAARELLKLLAP